MNRTEDQFTELFMLLNQFGQDTGDRESREKTDVCTL